MTRAAAALPEQWRNSIVRYADECPDQLLAHPLNPKVHPKTQQDALSGAISEVGWIAPVIVNETTGHVIDGHARIGLAISRGEPSVPVAYVQLTEQAERLALATFDPIGSLAGMDSDNMAALLEGLTSADAAVASLLRDLAPPKPKTLNPDDADLTPPAEPVTKTGDLWLLGDHRLLCGDSTNLTDVERLMNGRKADMVFTDPPYNVGLTYSQYEDDLSEADYGQFCADFMALALSHAPFVVVTPGKANGYLYYRRFDVLDSATWFKKFGLSRGHVYKAMVTEPILFFGIKPTGRHLPTDHLEHMTDRTVDEGAHACPKPITLVTDLLATFTERGSHTLDLFGGSGTTLIAAEQTNRVAYLMEIDPGYCDVIVRRWECLTGRQSSRG